MLNCKEEIQTLLNFSARLKKERNQLKLNQQDFATKAGVSKTTQFNYEKGDRQPDAAYLAAIAKMGVDITYLITGSHSLKSELTPEEEHLIENYRHASDEQKRSIYQVSEAFAAYATPKKPSHWHRTANHTPIIFFSGFEGELHYMEELAKDEGLKISEAGRVTRLTDWAVLSDTASKTHRTTAIDLNVPILNRDDFYNMANTDDGAD
jgi:transcriptional regulator with XRE-family HTH domain